jgi:hypothetical protein
VTSVAVPPVLRLALLRRTTRWPLAGHASRGRGRRRPAWRARDVVEADPRQRGGVPLAAAAGRGSPRRPAACTVCCAVAGHQRRVAARGGHQPVSRPPAGGSRCRAGSARPSPRRGRRRPPPTPTPLPRGLRRSTATPLPWLPSRGLTTTGSPTSWAAAQASAALAHGAAQWHRHTGRVPAVPW